MKLLRRKETRSFRLAYPTGSISMRVRLPLLRPTAKDEAGLVSYPLARSFRIVDPDLESPGPEEWRRAFKLFNLLL